MGNNNMSIDSLTKSQPPTPRATSLLCFMLFALSLLLVFILQITYQAQLFDLSKDFIISLQ